MKYRARKIVPTTVSWISLLLLIGTLFPTSAQASILDFFILGKKTENTTQNNVESSKNLQTIDLPQPAMNLNPSAVGGGDINIIDNSAVVSQDGPSGTIADIVKPKNGTIITHTVRDGDTLSSIAKLFDIPQSTILWSNDLTKKSVIKPGDKIIILPVPGMKYTVKKGDTLAGIAKRHGADSYDIASYNNIDDESLEVGTEIIIPNGEPTTSDTPIKVTSTTKKTSRVSANEPTHDVGQNGSISEVSYYEAPLSRYKKTQGIHGYNGIDLAPIGNKNAPIIASAEGDVIVARENGWNGGYGSYVVIKHNNGSQTLYAHMSKVSTYDGDHVQQGEIIGYVGNSGKSTGYHLHFEIRDGIRNPF